MVNLEDFNKYFLEAQISGSEVYLGEKIALVVYNKENCIGIDIAPGSEIFYYGPQFGVISNLPKDLENILKEIRIPENRKGITSSLNKYLFNLANYLVNNQECFDCGDLFFRY